MNCPKCNSKTIVIDSRQKTEYKYRRRKCTECNAKFSTYEYYEKPEIEAGCKMDCFNCPFPDCIK